MRERGLGRGSPRGRLYRLGNLLLLIGALSLVLAGVLYITDPSRKGTILPPPVALVGASEEATATLITCAGEWVPEKREFTQRLIVAAKLRLAKARDE